MKRARIKRFKTKRIKFFLLSVVLFLSFSITIKHLYNRDININNKDNLNYIISESYKNKGKYSYIVNMIIKIFTKVDLNEPTTFLTFNKTKDKKNVKEEYKKEDEYNPSDYEKITSYIKVDNNIKDPLVYIYNTHQLETYSSEGLVNNMVPNVMMAGSLLKEKLNKLKIPTIFEDTNLSNFIEEMGLPSNELYGGSRVFISNAKDNYKTLKYFIDLHRDSVSKDISTINIGNKSYARILFVLGVTNEKYQENEKMMNRLNEIINEDYPKLSRGIYEVDIPDWPEIYNQDMDNNAILIELGAKDNTMNEVLNTLDVLSNAISKYVGEEN